MREIRIGCLECVDAADSAGDRHVLSAVVLPGDRLADDAGGRLKSPQNLAGFAVDGDKFTGEFAGEDEAAGRDKRAGPNWDS